MALLAQVGIRVVMVHGGGKQATQLSKQLGIEPQMIQGRRVTDEETLDVVMMVFAGTINTEILAALREYGAEPVGISGVDGGIINAVKRPPKKVKDEKTGTRRWSTSATSATSRRWIPSCSRRSSPRTSCP